MSNSSAKPTATRAGQDASWNFTNIERGTTRSIDVSVKPLQEGDYSIDSTITVDNNFGINFFAGQPKLLVKTGGRYRTRREATWTVTVPPWLGSGHQRDRQRQPARPSKRPAT